MADSPRTLNPHGRPNLGIAPDKLPSDLAPPRTGGLEKEDVVVLILSAVLVVATLWLATYVL